jgi:hypothetical protein
MCLETITQRKDIRDGYGYKIFKLHKRKLYSECRKKDIIRRCGVWLEAEESPKYISSMLEGRYKSGFHILTSRAAARIWRTGADWNENNKYVIRKVKYRKATVIGMQEHHQCIVAKEIKIEGKDII